MSSRFLRFCTVASESTPSCQRAPEAPYAFATSKRSIPPTVSSARNPSSSVLSTSGIRNHDALQRRYAPAAQEVHHVRSLLRSPGIGEVALPSCLHEHPVALARVYEADGQGARRRRARSSAEAFQEQVQLRAGGRGQSQQQERREQTHPCRTEPIFGAPPSFGTNDHRRVYRSVATKP